MKNSIELKFRKKSDIKIGDSVFLIDGSGLTSIDCIDKSIYIVYPYPEITKDSRSLQNIEGTILEINIDNHACVYGNVTAYVQDVIVKIGEGRFRTCSNFVSKINSKIN